MRATLGPAVACAWPAPPANSRILSALASVPFALEAPIPRGLAKQATPRAPCAQPEGIHLQVATPSWIACATLGIRVPTARIAVLVYLANSKTRAAPWPARFAHGASTAQGWRRGHAVIAPPTPFRGREALFPRIVSVMRAILGRMEVFVTHAQQEPIKM